MLSSSKTTLALAAVLGGAASICPLCGGGPGIAAAQPEMAATIQRADTATVRLRISRMTCGSCATTARFALERLPGVHRATVSYDDKLGVVQYDPRRVTPDEIIAHLARLTGYGAAVIAESNDIPASPGERPR